MKPCLHWQGWRNATLNYADLLGSQCGAGAGAAVEEVAACVARETFTREEVVPLAYLGVTNMTNVMARVQRIAGYGLGVLTGLCRYPSPPGGKT